MVKGIVMYGILCAGLWMGCSKKEEEEISAEEMLKEPKDTLPPAVTPEPVTETPPLPKEEIYSPRISKDGPYVVQISVYAQRRAADRLAERLTGDGYPAYVAEVESPTGELPGTFYRVRVAGFDGVSLAREFGEKIVVKMGYEFWVDNKSNDNVGAQTSSAPTSSPSSSSSSSYSTYAPAPEQSYPKVEETPAAAPAAPEPAAASPAPEMPAAQAPTPEPAAAPAQAPAAPAAASPAGGTGGEWDWDAKPDSAKSKAPAGEKKSEWDF